MQGIGTEKGAEPAKLPRSSMKTKNKNGLCQGISVGFVGKGGTTKLRTTAKTSNRRTSICRGDQPANHARMLTCPSQTLWAHRHTCSVHTADSGVSRCSSEKVFVKDSLLHKPASSIERLDGTLATNGYHQQGEVSAKGSLKQKKTTLSSLPNYKNKVSAAAWATPVTEERLPGRCRFVQKECEARGKTHRASKELFVVRKRTGCLTCRKSNISMFARALRKRKILRICVASSPKTPAKKRDRHDPAHFRNGLSSRSKRDKPSRVKLHSSHIQDIGFSTWFQDTIAVRSCCRESTVSSCQRGNNVRCSVCRNGIHTVRRSRACVSRGSVSRPTSTPYRCTSTSEDHLLYYELPRCNSRNFESVKRHPGDELTACSNTCKFVIHEHHAGNESTAGSERRPSSGADEHVCRCSRCATAGGTSNEASSVQRILERIQSPKTPEKHEEVQHRHQSKREHYLKVKQYTRVATEDKSVSVNESVSQASPVSPGVNRSQHIRQPIQDLNNSHHTPPQQRSNVFPNQQQERAAQQRRKRDALSAQEQHQLWQHQPQQERRRKLPGADVSDSVDTFHQWWHKRRSPTPNFATILSTSNCTKTETTTAAHSIKARHLPNESGGPDGNSYIGSLPALLSSFGALVNTLFTEGVAFCASPSASSGLESEKISRLSSHVETDATASSRPDTKLIAPFQPPAIEERRGSTAMPTKGRQHSRSLGHAANREHLKPQPTQARSNAADAAPAQLPIAPGMPVITTAAGGIRAQECVVASAVSDSTRHDHLTECACLKQFYVTTNEFLSDTQQQGQPLHARFTQSSAAAEGERGVSVAVAGIEERRAGERRAATDGRGRVTIAAGVVSAERKVTTVPAAVGPSTSSADTGLRGANICGSWAVPTATGLSRDPTTLALNCEKTAWGKKTTGVSAGGGSRRNSAVAVVGKVDPLVFCEAYAEGGGLVATRNTTEAVVEHVSRGSAVPAATQTVAVATRRKATVFASRPAASAIEAEASGACTVVTGKEGDYLLQEECSCCCHTTDCKERKTLWIAPQQQILQEEEGTSASVLLRSQLQTSSIPGLPADCTDNGSCIFWQQDTHTDEECDAGRLQITSGCPGCCCVLSRCPTSSSLCYIRSCSSSSTYHTANSTCREEVGKGGEGEEGGSCSYGPGSKDRSSGSAERIDDCCCCAGKSYHFSCSSCCRIEGFSSSTVRKPASPSCRCLEDKSRSLPPLTAAGRTAPAGGAKAKAREQQHFASLSLLSRSYPSCSCCSRSIVRKEVRIFNQPYSSRHPSCCSSQANTEELKSLKGSGSAADWDALSAKREIDETDADRRQRSDYSTFSTSSRYASEDPAIPEYGEALLLLLAGSSLESEKSLSPLSPRMRRGGVIDSALFSPSTSAVACASTSLHSSAVAGGPLLRSPVAPPFSAGTSECPAAGASTAPAPSPASATVAPSSIGVDAGASIALPAARFCLDPPFCRRKEEEEDRALIADIVEMLGLLPKNQQEQQQLKTMVTPGPAEGGVVDGAAADSKAKSQHRGDELADAPAQYLVPERESSLQSEAVAVAAAAEEEKEVIAAAEEKIGDGARAAPVTRTTRQPEVSGSRTAGVAEARTDHAVQAAEEGAENLHDELTVERTAARLSCVPVMHHSLYGPAADIPAADGTPVSPCGMVTCAGNRLAAASTRFLSSPGGSEVPFPKRIAASFPAAVAALSFDGGISSPAVISAHCDGAAVAALCPTAEVHDSILQQCAEGNSLSPACFPHRMSLAVKESGTHSNKENERKETYRQQQQTQLRNQKQHFEQHPECEKWVLKLPEQRQQQHMQKWQLRRQHQDGFKQERDQEGKRKWQEDDEKEEGEGKEEEECIHEGRQHGMHMQDQQHYHRKENEKQPRPPNEDDVSGLNSTIVSFSANNDGLLLLHRSVCTSTDATSSRTSNAAAEDNSRANVEELRKEQRQVQQQLRRRWQPHRERETSSSESGKSVMIYEATEVTTPEDVEGSEDGKSIGEKDLQDGESGTTEEKQKSRREKTTEKEIISGKGKEEEEQQQSREDRLAVLEELTDKAREKVQGGEEEKEQEEEDEEEGNEEGFLRRGGEEWLRKKREGEEQAVRSDKEAMEKGQHLQQFGATEAPAAEASTAAAPDSIARGVALTVTRENVRCTEGGRRGGGAVVETGKARRRDALQQQLKRGRVKEGKEKGTSEEEEISGYARKTVFTRRGRSASAAAEDLVIERASAAVADAVAAVAEEEQRENREKENKVTSWSVTEQHNPGRPWLLKKRSYILLQHEPVQKEEKKEAAGLIQAEKPDLNSTRGVKGEKEGTLLHSWGVITPAAGGIDPSASPRAVPAQPAAPKAGARGAPDTPTSPAALLLTARDNDCVELSTSEGKRRRRRRRKSSFHLDRQSVSEDAELHLRQPCMHAARGTAVPAPVFASRFVSSVPYGADSSVFSPFSSDSRSLCSSSFSSSSDTTRPSVVAGACMFSPLVSPAAFSALQPIHRCSRALTSPDAVGVSPSLPASRAIGSAGATAAVHPSTSLTIRPQHTEANRAQQRLRDGNATAAESLSTKKSAAETHSLREEGTQSLKQCPRSGDGESKNRAKVVILPVGASPAAGLLTSAKLNLTVAAAAGEEEGEFRIEREDAEGRGRAGQREQTKKRQGIFPVLHKLWVKIKQKEFTQRDILYAALLPSLVVAIIPLTAAVGLLAFACLPLCGMVPAAVLALLPLLEGEGQATSSMEEKQELKQEKLLWLVLLALLLLPLITCLAAALLALATFLLFLSSPLAGLMIPLLSLLAAGVLLAINATTAAGLFLYFPQPCADAAAEAPSYMWP